MRIQLRVSELPQEPPSVATLEGGLVEVRFGEALSITLPAATAEMLGGQLLGAGISNAEVLLDPDEEATT